MPLVCFELWVSYSKVTAYWIDWELINKPPKSTVRKRSPEETWRWHSRLFSGHASWVCVWCWSPPSPRQQRNETTRARPWIHSFPALKKVTTKSNMNEYQINKQMKTCWLVILLTNRLNFKTVSEKVLAPWLQTMCNYKHLCFSFFLVLFPFKSCENQWTGSCSNCVINHFCHFWQSNINFLMLMHFWQLLDLKNMHCITSKLLCTFDKHLWRLDEL